MVSLKTFDEKNHDKLQLTGCRSLDQLAKPTFRSHWTLILADFGRDQFRSSESESPNLNPDPE